MLGTTINRRLIHVSEDGSVYIYIYTPPHLNREPQGYRRTVNDTECMFFIVCPLSTCKNT